MMLHSIIKMRYKLNICFVIKPDFFQKRYSINGVNKDEMNKDYVDIYETE